MSGKRYQCRKCGKARKRGAMSRDRAFCAKCVKRQKAAVKAQHARLVKAGVVTVTKGARPSAAAMVPRFTAGPLLWDPVSRESHAPRPGGPEQAEMRAAQMLAKAAGCRSVKEFYLTTAQADARELARRVMQITGEW